MCHVHYMLTEYAARLAFVPTVREGMVRVEQPHVRKSACRCERDEAAAHTEL